MSEPHGIAIELRRRDGRVIAYARVDASDFSWLSRWTWRLSSEGYAVRSETIDGKKRTIYMHREICNPLPGLVVDHINRDKLDNRRHNLRAVTVGVNNRNSRERARASRFRGVYWHGQAKKWYAQISENGRNRHLGIYESEEEAANAYRKHRSQNYGTTRFVS